MQNCNPIKQYRECIRIFSLPAKSQIPINHLHNTFISPLVIEQILFYVFPNSTAFHMGNWKMNSPSVSINYPLGIPMINDFGNFCEDVKSMKPFFLSPLRENDIKIDVCWHFRNGLASLWKAIGIIRCWFFCFYFC